MREGELLYGGTAADTRQAEKLNPYFTSLTNYVSAKMPRNSRKKMMGPAKKAPGRLYGLESGLGQEFSSGKMVYLRRSGPFGVALPVLFEN